MIKIEHLIEQVLLSIGWYRCNDVIYSSDGVILLEIKKKKNNKRSNFKRLNLIIALDRISILNPYKNKDYKEGKISLYDPYSLDKLDRILNNAECYTTTETNKTEVEV